MDFVSDFALLFDESEYEDVSDDEYEHGMDISDSEEENDVPGADDIDPSTVYKSGLRRLVGRWRNPKLMEEFLRTQTVTRYPSDGRRYRRADTNILSMKCDKLLSCRYTYSAKAVYCKSCYAILSHISLVQNKIWTCEFCGTENQVRLENEELPRYAYDDLSFLLEPAVSDTVSIETDDTLVIFCIDISGSMCVTTPVAGKFRLRGVDRPSSIDLADQYLPGEDKDITYVSRLQAAQAAIDQQLEDMSRKHPNRRVALVTFNSQVQVIGDGTIESITVSGDALLDKDELNYIGSTIKLPKPISNTREILGDKVFELEEGTVTALGPALTVAVSIASQRPRSKVIICTDGRANSGLGKLDELNTDEDEENARKFYKDVGTHALKKGVAISVIGIKGTDCKMVHLGKLADITGGQVNMVDPQTLPKEFSNILAEPVIATNVTVTLVLPNKLYCYDSSGAVSNRRVKTVGNVTSSTEITFQYNVKSNKKRNQQNQQEQQQSQQEQQQCQQEQQEQQQCQQEQQQCQQEQQEQQQCQQEQQEQQQCQQEQQQQQEGRGSSDTSSEQLPFQLQVHYKALNGAKILRVFTEKRPVTRDRKLAERRINLDILGKHTANVTAQLAMDGKYTRCRSIALMNQRLASRYTKTSEEGKCQRNKYKRIFKKIKSMENEINTLQKKERLKLGHTYSDDEDEVGVLQSLLPDTKTKITTKVNKRTSECNDETATLIFQCKSCKFD